MQSRLLSQDILKDHHQATNFLKQGKLQEAENLYKKILKIDPNFIKAYNNLGIVFRQQGNLELAEENYRKAIKLDPNYFQAYGNLGNIFKMQGKFEQAEKNYRQALEINPNFVDAYNSLGAVLQLLGRLEEAAESYEKAIRLNPGYMDAYGNLGGVLLMLGRIDQAEACLRAVQNSDKLPGPLYNLANLLKEKGEIKEAADLYKKVMDQVPDYTEAYNGLLQCLKGLCSWEEVAQISKKLRELTEKELKRGERPGETPFTAISDTDDPVRNLEIAKAWSKYFEKKVLSQNPGFYFDRVRKTHNKIRVGYVSKDFTDHPIGHIIKSMFAKHDKRKFEIYCFSFGGSGNDIYRKRVQKSVKHFIDITPMSFLDAARRIHAEEIDILVDLMGYTNGSRLEIFALRPSPIQISYLGFPGSMGADFIDYQIVDKTIIPEGMEKYYTEQLIFMPNCYQINDSDQKISRKKFKRSDFELPKDAFVFCSFNRLFKITPSVFDAWLRILKSVPHSVLWLQEGDPIAMETLKKEAKTKGVGRERLIFSPMIPLEQHLKRLKLTDLMLDTYPYSGGATTSHALRMGIPVVTLAGKTYLSRMSASLLKAVGLEKFITSSLKEYEKIAVSYAKKPQKFKNPSKSSIFNTKRFVKTLEIAYQIVFNLYKDGQKPRSIEFKVVTSKRPM